MVQVEKKGVSAKKICEMLFSANAFENNPLTEQELANHFGVSRTPIRDALKELEKEGIVERKQRRGVYLKQPSVKEIAEIYDLRSILEGFAARLTAKNATKKDIKELRTLAERFTQTKKDGNAEKCDEINVIFHNKIIRLSGNSTLIKITDNFRIIQRAFILTNSLPAPEKEIIPTNPYPHELIVEKLSQRDSGECERILRAHVQRTKELLIERTLGFKINHFRTI